MHNTRYFHNAFWNLLLTDFLTPNETDIQELKFTHTVPFFFFGRAAWKLFHIPYKFFIFIWIFILLKRLVYFWKHTRRTYTLLKLLSYPFFLSRTRDRNVFIPLFTNDISPVFRILLHIKEIYISMIIHYFFNYFTVSFIRENTNSWDA